MPEELSREIRKLEARLEDFLEDEEDFVKGLKTCLEKFKELNNIIERLETRPNSRRLRINRTSPRGHQNAHRGIEKRKQS